MNKRQAKKFRKKQYEKRIKNCRVLIDKTRKGLDLINIWCTVECGNFTKFFNNLEKNIENAFNDALKK